MKSFLKTKDEPNEKNFWIGLTDARVEGVNEWLTSGQPVGSGFNNWLSPSEPKNLANINCVHTGLTSNRYWIMDDCANLNYALCETGT